MGPQLGEAIGNEVRHQSVFVQFLGVVEQAIAPGSIEFRRGAARSRPGQGFRGNPAVINGHQAFRAGSQEGLPPIVPHRKGVATGVTVAQVMEQQGRIQGFRGLPVDRPGQHHLAKLPIGNIFQGRSGRRQKGRIIRRGQFPPAGLVTGCPGGQAGAAAAPLQQSIERLPQFPTELIQIGATIHPSIGRECGDGALGGGAANHLPAGQKNQRLPKGTAQVARFIEEGKCTKQRRNRSGQGRAIALGHAIGPLTRSQQAMNLSSKSFGFCEPIAPGHRQSHRAIKGSNCRSTIGFFKIKTEAIRLGKLSKNFQGIERRNFKS